MSVCISVAGLTCKDDIVKAVQSQLQRIEYTNTLYFLLVEVFNKIPSHSVLETKVSVKYGELTVDLPVRLLSKGYFIHYCYTKEPNF